VDWKNDPELRALWEDFVGSLPDRRKKLLAATDPNEMQIIAHNLAGVAETYGFPNLSKTAAELDDFLALELQKIRLGKIPHLISRSSETSLVSSRGSRTRSPRARI